MKQEKSGPSPSTQPNPSPKTSPPKDEMQKNTTPLADRFPIQLARSRRRFGQAIGLSPSTLVLLRWIAVVGQSIALFVSQIVLSLDVATLPVTMAITALAISNIILMTRRRQRLTEPMAVLILGFDLVQLSILVGVTGGLQNPFALLMLAPVTVSATVLSRKATLTLTLLAVSATTILFFWHYPLPWSTPAGVGLPLVYQLGIWTSITMSLVFIGAYVWSVSEDTRRMTRAFSESAEALSREREMSSLGALAAAAAHELGSPLATIAVVSKELMTQIEKNSPIYEDIELLKSQSDRCRDILRGLSQRPDEASDDPFETQLISNLVELATDEHIPDEIDLQITVDEASIGPEPVALKTPELLQGLGNFASNAGQFARNWVKITIYWTERDVWVSIHDDGPGFSHAALQALGEPYVSTREGKDGHMGLGVFIAVTLLERIGGQSTFRNRRGAEILVHWHRETLETAPSAL